MIRKIYIFSFFILLSFASQVYSQCSLGNSFGNINAPTNLGTTTTISTCSFLGEYSTVSNIQAGSSYSINLVSPTPNTIVQGMVTIYLAGTTVPVAYGPTPFVFNAYTSGSYLMQWNGPSCFTATNCLISTISLQGSILPSCTGPIVAGFITSLSTSVCSGSPVSLAIGGGSTGMGIGYQWQVSSNGGAFVNVPGGTGIYMSTIQQVPSSYRCIVNCNSTLFDTSASVSIGLNTPTACYCISQATNTMDEDIFNVTLSNLNNSSTCSSIGPGSSISNEYSDYTSIPPVLLALGNSYPMSVSIGTCGSVNFNSMVKGWIDFNQNGSFLDAGEEILATPSPQIGAYTFTSNITIPLNAMPGLTRMRIVNVETSFINNVQPCGTYLWGETEDYMVQIGTTTAFACINGTVYCDNNSNGVMDSSDLNLSSVPLILSYNGQNEVASTSSNGEYFFGFQLDSNANSATVSLDPAWLAQNGVQSSSSIITVTQLNCASSNPSFNFAVNCDSSSIQTSCVVGWVYCDSNSNGIMDNFEIAFSNAPIQLSNGVTVYTDSNGMFSYSGGQNPNGSLTASVANYWLLQNAYSLTNNSFTVFTNCDSLTPIYFGLDCSGTPCSDLYTTVTPWIGYFQNQNAYVKINWGSYGPNPHTGFTLTLTYPSGVTLNTSTIQNQNYSISGNTITWVYAPSVSSSYQTDIIQFFVPSGFPSGINHVYSSTIYANGSTMDCDSSNNDGSLCMILGNSYDPNDKSTSLPTTIDPGTQEELTYVIRFQNTGTAPAQDVYIIDSLSPNLDWSTLKLISHSHYMQLIDLGNGVMKFNFPGIWLPDSTSNEQASHGDVVFTIKESATNTVGSVIENTGYIFFDWNPAIVTNTTLNVNAYLGLEDVKANEVSVYPNPFENKLVVTASTLLKSLDILDMTGKQVVQISAEGFSKTVDLSEISSGFYLLRIRSEGETVVKRISKQ